MFKLKSNHCITSLNPYHYALFKLCLQQSSNSLQTYLKPWSNQQQILPRVHHEIGRHAQAFEPHLASTWAALFVHGSLSLESVQSVINQCISAETNCTQAQKTRKVEPLLYYDEVQLQSVALLQVPPQFISCSPSCVTMDLTSVTRPLLHDEAAEYACRHAGK